MPTTSQPTSSRPGSAVARSLDRREDTGLAPVGRDFLPEVLAGEPEHLEIRSRTVTAALCSFGPCGLGGCWH
jgi:hypothetical protein